MKKAPISNPRGSLVSLFLELFLLIIVSNDALFAQTQESNIGPTDKTSSTEVGSIEIVNAYERYTVISVNSDITHVLSALSDKSGVPITIIPPPDRDLTISVIIYNSSLFDVINIILREANTGGFVIEKKRNDGEISDYEIHVQLLSGYAPGRLTSSETTISKNIQTKGELPNHIVPTHNLALDQHESLFQKTLSYEIEALSKDYSRTE